MTRMAHRLRRSGIGLLALTLAAAPTGPARAQAAPAESVVTVAGSGTTTYVLIGGLVGGVAQFGRLRERLVAEGHRVVAVDPYGLSLDSADVTFAALARRVDAVLARQGVDSARVVGHAHGAGVALRLAALNPDRVSALWFLDVGALAENRTKVFSSSLRLAPVVARMPGGRGFVRRQYVKGLRQNAGRQEWLDAPTQRAYTEPFLNHLSSAVALAGRLARAREPELLSTVVSRVRVPVTVLVGDAPHPAAPDDAELAALGPLGELLRVERIPDVGHFPHEEAPAEVAARLLERTFRSRATVSARDRSTRPGS